MKEMDSYVTYVNDAINNLYENKQILEENFREKNKQQSIRKIGF